MLRSRLLFLNILLLLVRCSATAGAEGAMQQAGTEAAAKAGSAGTSLGSADVVDPREFAERPYRLPNGIEGVPVRIASHSPVDYGPLLRGELGPAVTLTGQIFLPTGSGHAFPAVVETPGSGNLGPHHMKHAAELTSVGIAVLVIDPFFGRGIKDTIADQNQMSFAASAYDVLAAVEFLRGRKEIDGRRIGATGGSRGGTAVLMAETAPLSDAVLGKGKGLRAVVAGYPWCGVQFHSARIATGASLLVLSGDRDDWVSPQQCQDETHAMQVAGQDVVMRLFPGAIHAFDREGVAPRAVPDAVTSTTFPTVYMDDRGSYYNMRTGKVDPALTSIDFTRYSVRGGFVKKGTMIGSTGDEARAFSAEMVAFFEEKLKR